MKPKLFLICLLLGSFTFSAFAQKSDGTESTPKTIQLKEVFTALSVESDITVILTDGVSDKIVVDGDEKEVKANVIDGVLYLSAKHPHLAADIKVYVPATYVSKVYMNGNGSLTSDSVLSTRKMQIHLASEARINVKSTGNVSVIASSDIQFVKGR